MAFTAPAFSLPSDADSQPHRATEPAISLWKTWLVAVLLALIFGLIEAAQLRLGSAVLADPMPMSTAARRVLPYWLVLACFAPLLLYVARLSRFRRYLLRPSIATFATTALTFALIALALRVSVAALPSRFGPAEGTPRQIFQIYFVLDLLTYTALVGTLYAFHYYREARIRELTASRLQTSLVETRLQVVEAQVDPELLFNALDAIAALARSGRHAEVVEMLGTLSGHLRIALTDERAPQTTLTRELELVRGYLDLQQIRFAGRLSWVEDVADEVREVAVPRALLTPLVENAMVRGLASSGERGTLSVRARLMANSRLRIEIADTFHWFTADGSSDIADDISLAGARVRLQHHHGDACSVERSDSPEGGTMVTIEMPVRG